MQTMTILIITIIIQISTSNSKYLHLPLLQENLGSAAEVVVGRWSGFERPRQGVGLKKYNRFTELTARMKNVGKMEGKGEQGRAGEGEGKGDNK